MKSVGRWWCYAMLWNVEGLSTCVSPSLFFICWCNPSKLWSWVWAQLKPAQLHNIRYEIWNLCNLVIGSSLNSVQGHLNYSCMERFSELVRNLNHRKDSKPVLKFCKLQELKNCGFRVNRLVTEQLRVRASIHQQGIFSSLVPKVLEVLLPQFT